MCGYEWSGIWWSGGMEYGGMVEWNMVELLGWISLSLIYFREHGLSFILIFLPCHLACFSFSLSFCHALWHAFLFLLFLPCFFGMLFFLHSPCLYQEYLEREIIEHGAFIFVDGWWKMFANSQCRNCKWEVVCVRGSQSLRIWKLHSKVTTIWQSSLR